LSPVTVYNGGNSYLLSALINKKSGQNALDYAKKELFEPLGIKSANWGSVDAQSRTAKLAFSFRRMTWRGLVSVLKDNEFYSVTGLIDDISRAVKSDKALQANSITIALLANAIRQAATEKASAIGGMPELAKAIGVDVMTGPARIMRSCGWSAARHSGGSSSHARVGTVSGTWKSAVVLFTIQSGPLKKQHSCELEK